MAATNKYFDSTGLGVADGGLAKAIQLNSVTSQTNKAFDLIEADLNALELGTALAYAWANNDQGELIDGTNYPGEYSSKANAQEAQGWASGEGGVSTEADGVTTITRSSKEFSEDSSGFADASEVSKGLSEEWASNEVGDIVEATDYSSKAYATESRGYANANVGFPVFKADGTFDTFYSSYAQSYESRGHASEAENVIVTGADGNPTGTYSSLHWSAKSEGFAENSEFYATQAQSVVNQDLSAITKDLVLDSDPKSVFRGSLSNDSDGGAWAKRCENLSWYKETLNTATRGKTRPFPHDYLITGETNKVTIFDATDPDIPMWMVFEGINGVWESSVNMLFSSIASPITSVSMKNGVLTTGVLGVYGADFIADKGISWRQGGTRGYGEFNGGIEARNDAVGYTSKDTSQELINDNVNKVAMTVLPDAPIDQSTGIQVPTIIYGSDGGFGAIDGGAGVGTVKSVISGVSIADVSISDDNRVFVSVSDKVRVGAIPEIDYADIGTWDDYVLNSTTTTPAMKDSVLGKPVLPTLFAHSTGLTHYKENQQDPSKGMVAYQDTEQPPMWQVGDIKGAFLASTTEETIGTDTTTEHVTNGGFDSDVSGWTPINGTLVWNSGRAEYTETSNPGRFYQTIDTVIGQMYEVTMAIEGDTNAYISTTNSFTEEIATFGYKNRLVEETQTITFKATTETTFILCYGIVTGSATYWDNISVKASQNEVENGNFAADYAWDFTSGGWSIGSGVATTGGVDGFMSQGEPADYVEGQKLFVRLTMSARTLGYVNLQVGGSGGTVLAGNGNDTFEGVIIVGGDAGVAIRLIAGNSWDGDITDIQIYELTEPDRSYNDNPFQAVGQIDKVPVALGAELVWYEGFTQGDYMEQPYVASSDVGSGDFYVMGWFTRPDTAGGFGKLYYRQQDDDSGPIISIYISDNGTITFQTYDGTTNSNTTDGENYEADKPFFIVALKENGEKRIYIDGVETVAFTPATNNSLDGVAPITRLGQGALAEGGFDKGKLSEWTWGQGVPSDEQIKDIYDTEKKMFEVDSKCTLSSNYPDNSVIDVDYDSTTGIHKVLLENTMNEIQGFQTLSSIYNLPGFTAISSLNGSDLIGTVGLANYQQPAYNLREELEAKNEELAKLNSRPVTREVTVVAGVVSIQATLGFKPIEIYDGGSRKSFTTAFDGYYYYAEFTAVSTDILITEELK